MSYQDLNLCRKFNLADLSEEKNFDEIKNLHIALCKFSKALEMTILLNVLVEGKDQPLQAPTLDSDWSLFTSA